MQRYFREDRELGKCLRFIVCWYLGRRGWVVGNFYFLKFYFEVLFFFVVRRFVVVILRFSFSSRFGCILLVRGQLGFSMISMLLEKNFKISFCEELVESLYRRGSICIRSKCFLFFVCGFQRFKEGCVLLVENSEWFLLKIYGYTYSIVLKRRLIVDILFFVFFKCYGVV